MFPHLTSQRNRRNSCEFCPNSGFRSVPLLNQFSEELELSALLVDVQMISMVDSSLIQSAHSVLQVRSLNVKHVALILCCHARDVWPFVLRKVQYQRTSVGKLLQVAPKSGLNADV